MYPVSLIDPHARNVGQIILVTKQDMHTYAQFYRYKVSILLCFFPAWCLVLSDVNVLHWQCFTIPSSTTTSHVCSLHNNTLPLSAFCSCSMQTARFLAMPSLSVCLPLVLKTGRLQIIPVIPGNSRQIHPTCTQAHTIHTTHTAA